MCNLKVAIVTEGFNGTGYGHLTRCTALYQAFIENQINPIFIANCDEEGLNYCRAAQTVQFDWYTDNLGLIKLLEGCDIAVVDSYIAKYDLYEKISNIVKYPVYIDDYLRIDYPRGIVVNGTINAESFDYKNTSLNDYLLGISYMPIRKAFWDINLERTYNGKEKNILITFGGQDLKNLTNLILPVLLKCFPEFVYHVVLPSNNSFVLEDDYNKNKCYFYKTLSSEKMKELMLNCQVAVSAAGQTSYELSRIGIPSVLVGVAENQRLNVEGFFQIGFIKRKIWYNDLNVTSLIVDSIDEILNNAYSKNCVNDGQGARRIVKYLAGLN